EVWQSRLDEAEARGPAAQVAAAREYLRRKPRDLAALERLIEGLLAQGGRDEAVETLLRMLEIEPGFDGGYPSRKLCELGAAGRLPPAKRLMAAERAKEAAPDAAEQLLITVLEEEPGGHTPQALLVLIELAAANDPGGARHYAKRLSHDFALSPETDTARRKWPNLF
ncbi:MAG: hypothetical protein IH851_11550, partial [Armatimonadetes bacterium]|nr:hypothetical protein [Armatimonadota bacterium]